MEDDAIEAAFAVGGVVVAGPSAPPCPLPGEDLFVSTRRNCWVNCWSTQVATMYRCKPDGSGITQLSANIEHDNTPWPMPDGRVIYQRWEYVDRGQIFPQPLFQMNPDGTNQRGLYGNNSWFPTTIMHARGIPGTKRIVCVLSGHHSRQRGKLAVIDPALGRHEARGVQLIAPIRATEPPPRRSTLPSHIRTMNAARLARYPNRRA